MKSQLINMFEILKKIYLQIVIHLFMVHLNQNSNEMNGNFARSLLPFVFTATRQKLLVGFYH